MEYENEQNMTSQESSGLRFERYLPICPFCRTAAPHWQLEWSEDGARVLHRCGRCGGTLSSSSAGGGYLRVEATGVICSSGELMGREYPMSYFQDMAAAAEQPVPVYDQPVYDGYAYTQPYYEQKPVKETGPWRAFAILSFIFGIIGLVMAFIPYMNMVFLMLPIAGIVFGALGKRSKSRASKARTGMVLSIVATALSIIMAIVYPAVLFSILGAASYYLY